MMMTWCWAADGSPGRPLMNLSPQLREKQQALDALLRRFGRVVVAYSGGVDSTLLAKVARDVLGRDNAPAVTADSASLAREDLSDAISLARTLDLEHLVVRTAETEDPIYQANTAARCYVCKRALFQELEVIAAARGASAVLYGVLADDVIADRPGHQAALEHGVQAPLQQAGLSKLEVRELARALGLSNWDRPQNACLASRIPHGSEVTPERLRRVETAEAFLREQGFRQVRVRDLGDRARIEVEPEAVRRFWDPSLRLATELALHAAGFRAVSLDRRGYRPGGADDAPADEILLHAIARC